MAGVSGFTANAFLHLNTISQPQPHNTSMAEGDGFTAHAFRHLNTIAAHQSHTARQAIDDAFEMRNADAFQHHPPYTTSSAPHIISASERAKEVSRRSSAKYRLFHYPDIRAAKAKRIEEDPAFAQRVKELGVKASMTYRQKNSALIQKRRSDKRTDPIWRAREIERVARAKAKKLVPLNDVFSIVDYGPSRGGKGLKANRLVRKGTIIPYGALAIIGVRGKTVDRTYQMDASFIAVNSFSWDTITVDGVVFDAHPQLINGKVHDTWSYASYVNEASKVDLINCEMFPAPHNTAESITRAYREGTPLVGAWYIVTRDIQQGEQVLTHYGKSYPRKGYEVEKRKDVPPDVHQYCMDVLGELKGKRLRLNLDKAYNLIEIEA
jgi:hypothetical protein